MKEKKEGNTEVTKTNEVAMSAYSEENIAKLQTLMQTDEKEFKKSMQNLNSAVELTADYLEMEDGESMRFIYIGETNVKTESDVLNGVKLIGEDKKTYVTAGVVIVNSLTDLPVFTPVEISYLGVKKLAKGKTVKMYSVTLLN